MTGSLLAAAIVLGMYLPIVMFSGTAAALFLQRLIWPAWRGGTLSLDRYAIGLSAFLSLLAHATENTFYGLIRWFPETFGGLNDAYLIVGAWKAMILASAILALIALGDRGVAALRRLFAIAVLLTGLGVAAAALLR